MANLGNAWHLPGSPEPRGTAGMRDPVFPTSPVPEVTIITGNQYTGSGGDPGNQLQDGSALLFRRAADAGWQVVPLMFASTAGNNKYYSGQIPAGGFAAGTVIQYYLRIAYDDHATTFLQVAADGISSVATGDETAARAAPFSFIIDTPDKRGRWGETFSLRNVGIHCHVLPTGLVLMWGRRDSPQQSLDTDPPSPLEPGLPPAPAAQCTPFVWDPATGGMAPTPQPKAGDGTTNANLFCSGHAFLADGRLLVAGGHLADSHGLNQVSIYEPAAGTGTPSAVMNNGRWYPTAITLPDGSVLVLSGSFLDPARNAVANNVVPQIWSNGTFTGITPIPDAAFDLYPRMHVASTGLVYMTSLVQTWSLDVSGAGRWTALPGVTRLNGLRDYAPSVLYDVDKVIFIGGGNPPTANAEIIDLGQAQPAWRATGPMNFPRRQHNATILPDGTVLVTGGTRAGGAVGTAEAFNNLDPGQPVHIAELWDPHTGQWTQLAAEATDRCYHSTAVLLPDGRVLSAGSGEFVLDEGTPQQRQNDPQDTHLDAQVFSPPYLFKGARPEITSAPGAVRYGDTFEIGTAQPDDTGGVTVVRLSSVTHSFNVGQRINFLSFKVQGGSLQATAPAGPGACPPGHYMLFILNQQGVPSVAKIVQISAPASPTAPAPPAGQPQILSANAPGSAAAAPPDAFALRARMRDAATGTRVIVGIQATCPYGIAACWGGANEALRNLDGVKYVDPVPDANRSTATVYLDDDRLPPLDRWDRQFRQMVHDTYLLRGAEVTLNGTVEAREGVIVLAGEGRRPPVTLTPLQPGRKIQWDPGAASPEPAQESEAAAYSTLLRSSQRPHADRVTVTGPLSQTQAGYLLQVRLVE